MIIKQDRGYILYICIVPFVLWMVFNVMGSFVYLGFNILKYMIMFGEDKDVMFDPNLLSVPVVLYLSRACLGIFIIASVSVVLSTASGYLLLFMDDNLKKWILALIFISTQIPFVARVFVWKSLFDYGNGYLSAVIYMLKWLGILSPWEELSCSWLSIFIVMYNVVFVVVMLPIYVAVSRFPSSIIYAAFDLGAGHYRVFFDIYVPMMFLAIRVAYRSAVVLISGAYVVFDIIAGIDHAHIGCFLSDLFLLIGKTPLVSVMSLIVTFCIVLMVFIPEICGVIYNQVYRRMLFGRQYDLL